jgi:hypothetical protein
VPTLNFALSKADQEMLRTSGYDAAQAFFSTQRTYVNHAGVQAAGPAVAAGRS